jgi:diacylglycerol kinase family enzyme
VRHLFIINPQATRLRNKTNELVKEIEDFFRSEKNSNYDIHITRWERDATGYVRRYAQNADKPLRIHSCGGSGTLFEVVNGAVGIDDVEIAAYPMGRGNPLLRYFNKDIKHFKSIQKQVYSGTTPFDLLRCGHIYGITYGLIGIEALANRDGTALIERNTIIPEDLCYTLTAVKNILKKSIAGQNYTISLDGKSLDGYYATMMVANAPCYGVKLNPAIDAHPNDGIMDIYIIKRMSRIKLLLAVQKYVKGEYRKLPNLINHYRGSKITISSEDVMCIGIDGETFYENSIEYEIMPKAVNFVIPEGVDFGKIPLIYGGSVK